MGHFSLTSAEHTVITAIVLIAALVEIIDAFSRFIRKIDTLLLHDLDHKGIDRSGLQPPLSATSFPFAKWLRKASAIRLLAELRSQMNNIFLMIRSSQSVVSWY